MKIFLLGYGKRPGVREMVKKLHGEICEIAEIVVEDLTGKKDLSSHDADVALVFGGDGSILRAVRQMGFRQIPVMAVNLGRLGFMADVSPENLLPFLRDLKEQIAAQGADWKRLSRKDGLRGKNAPAFTISEHLLLRGTVKPKGGGQESSHVAISLNEVAVLNGTPHSILEIRLFADDELVTTYSCDGLILSTPVGSTAHSLSAGGPILCQALNAVVISPISPHTLTHRPVVDSAKKVYRLELAGPRKQHASVVVDGSVLCPLNEGDVLEVRESETSFLKINVPEYSYYSTLRKKLGWGGQMKQGLRD